MSKLLLSKQDFADKLVAEKICKFISPLKVEFAPVWIFDIHNTIIYEDEKIDVKLAKLITYLIKKGYTCMFLSYDGKDERIIKNEKLINDYSETFKKMPKIFIKKRHKGIVIKHIYDCLETTVKNKRTYMIIFIDDQIANINSTNSHQKEDILAFQYLKHTPKNLDNIHQLLERPSVMYGF